MGRVFFFWALTGPYPTLRFGVACGLGVGAFDLAKFHCSIIVNKRGAPSAAAATALVP
jgi:hypothetical protein